MLAAFRAFAKSWIARILIGALVVGLAFFGIRDVFKGRISDAVVTAGAREISPKQFKDTFQRVLKGQEQESGQQISLKDAVAAGFDDRILQELAGEELLNALITRMGLNPADSLIGDELRKQPAFFDPISGKFDMAAYRRALDNIGSNPTAFEAELHDQIAAQHLASGIGAGLKAPLTYAAVISGYQLEGRTFSYFVLDPRTFPVPKPPTGPQLMQFMQENAAQLTRPEMRILTVIRFSTKALIPTMPVDPAAVQKAYAESKDHLSQPERRTLVDIPVKDAGTAASVAARLKAGEKPDAVAKSMGEPAIVYTDQPKSAIADPKVADAAFAMHPGQVSGPIQGGLGMAVVELNAVTPAKTPSFEDMRAQLEQQARTDAAIQKVYDSVQKYDDAHGGGSSLADAARAAGGAPIQVGPVTAQGADVANRPVAGLTPRLLQTAFGLPQGGESDMEDEGAGEYYAVRVEKILPPALPSLQEIKAPLTQYYMQRSILAEIQAKADALAARIRKGGSLEAVAASAGAAVSHQVGVTRAQLGQAQQALGGDLVTKLLAAKNGEVIAAVRPNFVGMVARLDSILPPSPAEGGQAAVHQRDPLSTELFQDFDELAHTAARNIVKPTVDLDKARTALGLSPEDLPKTATKPKGLL